MKGVFLMNLKKFLKAALCSAMVVAMAVTAGCGGGDKKADSGKKENGGIVDDRYITDPAEVQGGETSVYPKDILTRLTAAQSGLSGHQLVRSSRRMFSSVTSH